MSITGNVIANMRWTEIKDGVALGEAQDNVPSTVANLIQAFTAGTGTGQIDGAFRLAQTIAAAATFNLTISGVNLTDEFGATFGLATLKAIIIINKSTGLAAVQFSLDNAATDEFAALIPVGSGSMPLQSPTGYAIVAATNDVLKFVNQGGGDANVEIYLVGVKE